MPSCNVAVNHRADTATDNRTQSCLSVFSQSPPPPPPQLQVVVGGAAKTMRESTFKVNWASRLLGRKWKWKWRILDYSLFVFSSLPLLLFFCFFFFCVCFFVVSVSFERSPNRTNLLAICVVRQGEFTFVCFAAPQNHLAQLAFFCPLLPPFYLCSSSLRLTSFLCLFGGRQISRPTPWCTNQIMLTHKLYVS